MVESSTRCTEGSPALPDRYRVDGILGQGGFGTVLRAWDHQMGRACAIKVARDATKTDRLVREARLAGSLRGAHSVRIFDVGVLDSGAPYVVMEHLQGETLSEYLSHTKVVAWTRAVEWMEQVCLALEEAHRAGLVHRDIKPSNLFLVQDPVSGKTLVKLLDFGLARLVVSQEGTLTDSDLVIGSPSYMSPEQVRNVAVGSPSDIWSVGVVLYQLLSGTRPFSHDSKSATLAAIVADPPAPLEDSAPHLPSALIQIVERCLSRRPQDRFNSAWELACRLRQTLAEATGSEADAMIEGSPPLARDAETESTGDLRKRRIRSGSLGPWVGLGVALTMTAIWLHRTTAIRTTATTHASAVPDGESEKILGAAESGRSPGLKGAWDAPTEDRGVILTNSEASPHTNAAPSAPQSSRENPMPTGEALVRNPYAKANEVKKPAKTLDNASPIRREPGLFEEPDF